MLGTVPGSRVYIQVAWEQGLTSMQDVGELQVVREMAR